MAENENVAMVIEPTVDWASSQKGIKDWSRGWQKSMRKMEKDSQKSMKGNGKAVSDFYHKIHGAQKMWGKEIDDANKRYYELQKAISKTATKLEELNKDIAAEKKLGKEANKEALDDYKKRIAAFEKLKDLQESKMQEIKEAKVEIEQKFTLDRGELVDAAKAAGAEMWAPFEALKSKDIPGAFEKGAEVAGFIIEKSFSKAGKLAAKAGSAIGGKGDKLWGKAKESMKGGLASKAKGVGQGAMGGMAKVMGGLVTKLGPLLNMFAKIGPLLSTVGGLLVGLVKMMIDAESAAKDFNKSILATNATADFLASNFDNVAAAEDDLRDSMKKLYDQATDVKENIAWGTSKKDFEEVINGLSAEGVSLAKLDQQLEMSTVGAKNYAAVIHMNVAYARAFGVSMQELSGYQAELMSETGESLEGTWKQFEYLKQTAAGAGIASNKFFNIIRGFTSDMSLFNLRMATTVMIMGQLMKTMSPKTAKAFFQTITQHYKGMGLIDRTKATLLAGEGKTKGRLQDDVGGKIQGIGADLADTLGKDFNTKELEDAVKAGPAETSQFIAKYQKQLSGSQKEAILDVQRMNSKVQAGGLVDIASALKDASPLTVMKHLDDISMNMFKKPIDKLSNVERIAVENLTGMGDEQVDQMSKMKAGLEQQKADIIYNLNKGIALSADQEKLMTHMGITGDKDTKIAELAKKDSDALWHAMSKDQKDMLAGQKKTRDFAHETVDLTSSMLDKLDVLLDWVMNQIYNVMQGIWESIDSFFDFWPFKGHEENKQKAMSRNAAKSRSKKTQEIVGGEGDSWTKRGKIIEQIIGPGLQKGFDDLHALQAKQAAGEKRINELMAKGKEGRTEEESAELKRLTKAMADNLKAVDAQKGKLNSDYAKVESKVTGQSLYNLIANKDTGADIGATSQKELLASVDRALNAKHAMSVSQMQEAGMSEKDIGTVISNALGDTKLTDLTKDVYLDPKQWEALQKKMVWYTSPEDTANLGLDTAKDYESSQEGKIAADAKAAAEKTAKASREAATTAADTHTAMTTNATIYVHDTHAEGHLEKMEKGLLDGASLTESLLGQMGNEPPVPTAEDEDMAEQSEAQADTLMAIWKALRMKGIKIEKFVGEHVKDTIHDAVLDAASEALLDYYMYQGAPQEEVAKALGAGVSPKEFGRKMREGMVKGGNPGEVLKDLQTPANASGGFVTSITGGLARISAAPGEGLASVGKGEAITPAGGGGGKVQVELSLKGDLGRIINAHADDRYAINRSREKFR